ncbi:MAG: 5'/3'-nucleotidase SurE [Desulfobulbaceae bacterium]|nr:5'/3'-nucleotidase SurE [Desulfobulbaceae bacterium]
MSTTPYILVTNDDGVHSPGLTALYEAMKSLGHTVVVAPARDNSAVSHSLTMDRPLRVHKVRDNVYTLDGTPTDCVTIGMNKVLSKKPDLLVSGINPGPNLGDDISYSGTVSAAIEGTMYSIPSLAVSAAGEGDHDFDTTANIASRLAQMVLHHGLPENTLLNINIPSGKLADLNQLRFTRQGRRLYKDGIQETFDPWGRKYFWIGGGTVHWSGEEGTDEQAVRDGFISVTPIQLDLTNHAGLEYLKNNWQW